MNAMDTTKNTESDVTNDTKEELRADSAKPEITPLGHQELIKLTKLAIDNIVESDPLLSGLPSDVTIEELRSQIAVARGQAITLFVNRGELPKLAVVVPPHDTTVLDLKKAIRRHMSLSLERENVKKKISWRHIWKRHHLCFEHVKLANNRENIKAYGLVNRAELHFVKKHREKNKLIRFNSTFSQ